MLGSQADAEDAVQSTFASVHRALLANDRWVDVRPWLFAVARNACLSSLRVRRPCEEVSTDLLASDDLTAANSGSIKLSPGLQESAQVQNITIKGKLTGCTGSTVTSATYLAHLKTTSPFATGTISGTASETFAGACGGGKGKKKAKKVKDGAFAGSALEFS